MTIELQRSTQFKINELVVVTKAGPIDISSIYEEISIFDSLFSPVISGSVLIRDSIGLSGRLIFDGSESLLVDIVKDENSEVASYKRSFRIYKQANRMNEGMNSEMYTLNFVTDELMYSDQQRINQAYENVYSQVVGRILENYLRVPQKDLKGFFESSFGIKKIVIPNLRPLEAIEWCAKRAVDGRNSPNYLFYQNIAGFNFVSLSSLLSKQDILEIKFEAKNLPGSDALSEITTARSFEVVTQNDSIEKTRMGVNAGRFIGFDPMTRSVNSRTISYADHYTTMSHGNKNPNFSVIQNRGGQTNENTFDARKTVSFFGTNRKFSNYIKRNDPASLSKLDDTENYIFQRKAILANLMSKRIKITMPGNFQLSSGFNVRVEAPFFGIKEKGDENKDVSLTGKYIIIGSRHIIGFEKHETIIEVATTSSENDVIPVSNPNQTTQVLSYA
jgi:hypothetical protein